MHEYQERKKQPPANKEASAARLSSDPSGEPSAAAVGRNEARGSTFSQSDVSDAQARRLANLEKMSSTAAASTKGEAGLGGGASSARSRDPGSQARPGSRPTSAAGVMRPISSTEERMLGRLDGELSTSAASGSRSQSLRNDQVRQPHQKKNSMSL